MADQGTEQQRLVALTELATAEAGLFRVLWEKFKAWAQRLAPAVFGRRPSADLAAPDPLGVFATAPWWQEQVDSSIVPRIRTVWRDSYEGAYHAADEIPWQPDAQAAFRNAAQQARNRLTRVPDSVYADVRALTMKAVTDGWSMDNLAGQVQGVLADSGAEQWRNRALTIARTEALSAYNGGKFASFQSQARSLGGSWEKIWLATHDHRTRFTHTEEGGGDLQRVGLLEPFVIGGAPLMYPGDPEGPPGEIINCRCTILLVEPDEQVDLSNRHYRSAK